MSTIPQSPILCYNSVTAGRQRSGGISEEGVSAFYPTYGAGTLDYLWSPWRMAYIQDTNKAETCIFCAAQALEDGMDNLIVHRGQKAYVILNRFPYTSGHIMVVPYQHQPSLELLDSATRAEIMELASQSTQVMQSVYNPQGFNIGINIGEAAGAGIVGHIHLHVVPRWNGDTNFMSSLGMTRVLPETLEDTLVRLTEGWKAFKNGS